LLSWIKFQFKYNWGVVSTSDLETTILIRRLSSVPAPFIDFHKRSAKYTAGLRAH